MKKPIVKFGFLAEKGERLQEVLGWPTWVQSAIEDEINEIRYTNKYGEEFVYIIEYKELTKEEQYEELLNELMEKSYDGLETLYGFLEDLETRFRKTGSYLNG